MGSATELSWSFRMRATKNKSTLVFALPLLLALVSLGCGLSGVLAESPTSSEPTPTRTPMPTFTPTPQGGAFIDVSIENNQSPPAQTETSGEGQPAAEPAPANPPAEEVATEPSPTPLPPEPTATPTEAFVSITVLQNMNVRGGPGTNYQVIGAAAAGDSSRVLGRNDNGSWLQVEYPSADGTGWIYAELVQVNGNAETVAIASAPPPPPPTPTPVPTEPPAPPPTPAPQYQFTPTGWHASPNPGIVHFKGRIRDEAGNLVNGYSVLLDNWSWSVVSHPTGPSHHYPEKGDGEWDVVIPTENLGDGVGWWWLTVVRYECPDFLTRFDAQCKQFTRLSEDVKIEVIWPDETVINADWICHWDCNKGLYVEGFHRDR